MNRRLSIEDPDSEQYKMRKAAELRQFELEQA
jgi:hypothetical protein